jgi:formylglycine-generating enzyme required for sulfatase activity
MIRKTRTALFIFLGLWNRPNAQENVVNSVGMEMVRIEPGRFIMGSCLLHDFWDEKPQHAVTIPACPKP